jgi:peptidyl-dipeptidase Dcp
VTIPEATGVFAQESTLPFETTDFSRIQDSDYKPGFEQAMAIQRAEIAAITANPEPPTFENTIVALEKSGRMLGRVQAASSAASAAPASKRLSMANSPQSGGFIGNRLTPASRRVNRAG